MLSLRTRWSKKSYKPKRLSIQMKNKSSQMTQIMSSHMTIANQKIKIPLPNASLIHKNTCSIAWTTKRSKSWMNKTLSSPTFISKTFHFITKGPWKIKFTAKITCITSTLGEETPYVRFTMISKKEASSLSYSSAGEEWKSSTTLRNSI